MIEDLSKIPEDIRTGATYHSNPAISASQLKTIATATLRHYWADYIDPERPERVETEAMRFGTQLHMLVLEPDRFSRQFHQDTTPLDAPRRPTVKQLESLDRPPRIGTKARDDYDRISAARDWWHGWDAAHPTPEGSEALSAERWQDLQSMAKSLVRCPVIGGLLTTPGVAEKPLFWHDPELGVDCRCKPDWLTIDGWVVDLKSTLSANPRRFRWQAWDLGYDIQAWWYLRGIEQTHNIKPKGFIFAAVEKKRPYISTPLLATQAFLDRGRSRTELALSQLLEARRNGDWHGYLPAGQIADLDPPSDRDAKPAADVEVELY